MREAAEPGFPGAMRACIAYPRCLSDVCIQRIAQYVSVRVREAIKHGLSAKTLTGPISCQCPVCALSAVGKLDCHTGGNQQQEYPENYLDDTRVDFIVHLNPET